jgi:predicted aldo/keto reductase-like oxidoreductase
MEKRKWPRLGLETSLLGYGCMRFPTLMNGEIDEEKTEALLDKAYASGVNYYDTAYIYHNGKSETFLGKCMDKYPRDSYYIATKLPVMMIDSLEKAKSTFEDQLKKLNKDYIDFYLLHGLSKMTFDRSVSLGIISFCEELKRQGRIKYLGFSFHDGYESFEQIIKYRDWDFCQIQLNYMDVEEQAGLKGYQLAESLDVPVVIMEPLKGGALATLPDTVGAVLKEMDPGASIASWGMRWIGSLPGVKVVLSGMTTMEQLEDNLKTFTDFRSLSDEELKAFDRVKDKFKERVKNGCTGCRYCMPCPAGVDIPGNFAIWNKYGMYENKQELGFSWGGFMFRDNLKAKHCVKCGQCEEKCPQKLNIRDDLETLQKELDDAMASFRRW